MIAIKQMLFKRQGWNKKKYGYIYNIIYEQALLHTTVLLTCFIYRFYTYKRCSCIHNNVLNVTEIPRQGKDHKNQMLYT